MKSKSELDDIVIDHMLNDSELLGKLYKLIKAKHPQKDDTQIDHILVHYVNNLLNNIRKEF